jgi:copper(I)-binding protein
MLHTLARLRTHALLPALVLALAVGLSGCGEGSDPADAADAGAPPAELVVGDPWVRATAGTADPSMTAAFMTIDNHTDADVTLEAVTSPVSDRVELHETAMVDGAMVMQAVEGGITITAGRGKLLEPGGYHVMLMDMKRELAPGEEVELTLRFSDGSSQTLTVPVKEFVEEQGHYHSPGTGAHTHPGAPSATP